MAATLITLLIALALTAGAALWALYAYRKAGGAAVKPLPALAVCFATGAFAFGTYMLIGQPGMADAPYEARLEALRRRDPESISIEEWLAVLHEAARREPQNAEPHLLRGRILMGTGRIEEASRAYDAALRRDPTLTEAQLGLARALVAIEQGHVSAEALRLVEAAAEGAPNDPTPWIYQAMAAMQDRREADVRRLWGEALRRMPADDPRREMAARMSQGT